MASDDADTKKTDPNANVAHLTLAHLENADLQQPPEQAGETGIADESRHPEYYSKIVVNQLKYRLHFLKGKGPPPPAPHRGLRQQIEDVARLLRPPFYGDKA